MGRLIPWIIRTLALIHFTWGAVLIAIAAWLAASSLLVLPHMTTGTFWIQLPISLILASIQFCPLGALGAWIVILGYRTWTRRTGLRKVLVTTHALLLLPGTLATAVGILALRAGARSAARGGGLLSPIGIYPLVLGAGLIILALGSILLAVTVIPKHEL